jgi:2-polyprenyl-3-methyl-5-hydroxy-6-metoxy-1,4-benzoquinol methylase
MDMVDAFEKCSLCAGSLQVYAKVQGLRAAQQKEFLYLECVSCHSVLLSHQTPQPTNIYEEKYYSSESVKISLFRQGEQLWIDFIHKLHLKRIPSLPKNAKVLDVGCGNGEWLRFLKSQGFETYGLDPSEEACKVARSHGLTQIIQGTLQDKLFPENFFDCITANHSVEHVENSTSFIESAVKLLKPGGWFQISLPNITSWEARRSRENWFHLDPPYHVSLISPQAMMQMMKNRNLIEIRQKSPALDCCQSLLYALWKRPKLPMIITVALLPFAILANTFLAAQNRSGVMEFSGRKV